MDVPFGTASYSYDQIETPVLSADPASAKPIAVAHSMGSAAATLFPVSGNAIIKSQSMSDGTFTVSVGFMPFAGSVDIYLALSAPEIDPDNVYWFDLDNTLHPSLEGLVIWRENSVGPIDEIILDNILVSSITPATYYLYAVVTPSGDTTNYYLWETSFLVMQQSCGNLPVKVLKTTPEYYPTIQSGYNAATSGVEIQSQSLAFAENLYFNRNTNVTLIGGFDCDYSNNPSNTLINGSLTISNGTVTIGKILLK